MEKITHCYVCEDSMEGIFTAIYDAWASGYGHANNRIQVSDERDYELFCDYILVTPEEEKSRKVIRTIKKTMGNEAYRYIYYMAISNEKEKADAIYRFMILGLHMGPSVLNHLSHDAVRPIMKTYKRVSMEGHHYRGFVRFQGLSNHILCSKIRPDNNLLTLLMPHFSDRLPNENFMIVDEGRGIAGVHPSKKEWFLVLTDQMTSPMLSDYSEQEQIMQQVWGTFVDSISIKERENYQLQRNMCPLRYREFMPEFQRQTKEKKGREYEVTE